MNIGMEGCGPNPRTYSKAEYDALHAEAEALQRQVTELEAARGLLANLVAALLQHETDKCNLIQRAKAFLTTTPAPEVRNEQAIPNASNGAGCSHLQGGEQAEQGERQEELSLFTCAGKGGEYAKLGYAKPAGAIKAIQGDSGLIIYRDTNGGQLYFRDPRDFKERMSPLAVMEPCSLGGDVIRQRTTEDTIPQPGPDVRALVEALEQIARWDGFPPTGKFWEGSGEPMSYSACYGSNGERDHMRNVAAEALAAHRQAQQGEQP